MVSKAGKMLLKNTIQSLEYQNKVREEKEMWNKLQNQRTGKKDSKRRHKDSDCHKKEPEEDIRHSDHTFKRHKTDDRKPDNYWLKKLMAAEEKQSNERWTHNGFKELYSEELQSNSSSISSESEEEVSKKKRKKKKKKHKHKKHKNKNKK